VAGGREVVEMTTGGFVPQVDSDGNGHERGGRGHDGDGECHLESADYGDGEPHGGESIWRADAAVLGLGDEYE